MISYPLRINLGDTVSMTVATLAVAAASPTTLSAEDHVHSYRNAQDTHIRNAKRLIDIAAWLNRSPIDSRRLRAIDAVHEAKRRLIAAETCRVLGMGIDHEITNWGVIDPDQHSSHHIVLNPVVLNDDWRTREMKTLGETIAIIDEFIQRPAPRRDDDEIPF